MRRLALLLAAGVLIAGLIPSAALAGRTAAAITGASAGTQSATSWVFNSSLTCTGTVTLTYAAGGGVKYVELLQDYGAPYTQVKYVAPVSRLGTATFTVTYSVSGYSTAYQPNYYADLATGRAAVTTPVYIGFLTADTWDGCSSTQSGAPTITYP